MDEIKSGYDGTKWRHLPSDKTLNQFAGEYRQKTGRSRRPSAAWIKTAIRKLDSNESADSVYNVLFQSRQGPESKRTGTERSTHPTLFPVEVLPLLTSIFMTRDQKKAKGEAYPTAVLETLGDQLKEALEGKMPEDFADVRYLTCRNVRDKLLRRFEPLFRHRIQLICDHFFDPKAEAQVNDLKLTLERLDIIISELPQNKKTELEPDGQALKNLYRDLLSERNKLVSEKVRAGDGREHLQWNPNVDTQLVEDMRRQIRSTRRDPSEEQAREFLDNYRKYLDYAVAPEEKEEARKFWEEYMKLDTYYFSEHGVERFEQDIREELNRFARDLFKDLMNLDTIGYSYSYFVPEHAMSSYARSKLADAHRAIQIKLHQAIRLLRTVYAYFFIRGDDAIFTVYEKHRRNQIAGYMIDQIAKLAKDYSQVPAVDFKDVNSLEPFLEAYREHAVPVFGDTIADKNILKQVFEPGFCTNPAKRYNKLLGIAEYLAMESKIVAAIEIEKTVQELVDEYKQMKNR